MKSRTKKRHSLNTVDQELALGNAVAKSADDGCEVRRVLTPLLQRIIPKCMSHTRERDVSVRVNKSEQNDSREPRPKAIGNPQSKDSAAFTGNDYIRHRLAIV